MRSCLITTFYPPHAFGGDAVFVYRLANMLPRRSHELDAIHCSVKYAPKTASDRTDWDNHLCGRMPFQSLKACAGINSRQTKWF
jgi:hypothetical protein